MRVVCFLAFAVFSLHAATFGRAVPLRGGGSDIVLDESHNRLYRGGAVSPTAAVYFGDPSWVQAAIIVDVAGLAPGTIGVYQLNLRVPGFHISGDSLLVTIKAGGVSSPSAGPVVPQVSVN